jgi:hypothetical protein
MRPINLDNEFSRSFCSEGSFFSKEPPLPAACLFALCSNVVHCKGKD